VQEFLPILIVGLVSGAVYGLAGTGLVLTYKTSGIFNFAHGSVAAVAVFIFYWLHVTHGMAWPLAGALCLFVLSPLEGLVLERLARGVENQGTAIQVAATIGLLLMVLGVGTIWYGSQTYIFPNFLPTASFKVAGVFVTWSDVVVFAVSMVGAGGLYYLFRHVRTGIAMRGLVDDPSLVALNGQSPIRIRRLSWMIGSCFASLAGLLIAPALGVDATAITLLVVQAFGAAAIGYLSSLPLTFFGGLGIGVISAVITQYTVNLPWLGGLPGGVPFIILLVVLIATPRSKLADRRARFGRIASTWRAPTRVQVAMGAAFLTVFALGPVLAGQDIFIWSILLIDVILFLSLGLLVRASGQVSLCHYTFAAIGAAAFCHFVPEWHVPWLLALLLAGAVAVPVGALVAIPAIRLPGVFLAVATLGFAILVENVFFTTRFMFGPNQDGIEIPGPHVSVFGLQLSSNNGMYYVILAITLVSVALVLVIERGRMGRFLAALAESPTALEVHGANIQVTRIVVFCIAAGMAGVAGALTGSLYHYAAGSEFEWFASVELAVIIIITVGGTPWYALLAAAAQAILPNYLPGSTDVVGYEYILFGLFAVLYAAQGGVVMGIPLWLRQRLDRLAPRPRLPAPSGAARAAAQSVVGSREDRLHSRSQATSGLEVRGLRVDFGGVHALADVSLSAELGVITGLIGPNGAGKTTLFNVCSGFVRPTSGSVSFGGQNLAGVSRSARARLGLGRTFQRTELFNSLSVRQNVAIGREAAIGGRNPLAQLRTRPREAVWVEGAVEEALSVVGLEEVADRPAGTLTTGQRRLVEFARALAGHFDMVMLDEPSAGLDSDETAAFGRLLKSVVRERGTGILLVEHDISLVREICDKIYVLDFGQLIYEGIPEAMSSSAAVRSAYLGEEIEELIEPESVVLSTGSGHGDSVSDGILSASAHGATDVAAKSEAVPPGEPALSLIGIHAGYGAVPVLRDVSITVPPGGVVAVLGPNGAGKTTLLRVTTGLLRPQQGRIVLEGEDITTLPPERIVQRGICHIPESRGVFPSLSVKENIILASRKGHEGLALEQVGERFPVLAARLHQTAGSLSGGEQQMLSIARAFLHDPKVLAVDEASLGLSPAAVETVYDALTEIRAQGVSLILVEQYVQRALNFADAVYILTRGRVVYSGRASDLDPEEVMAKYLGDDTDSAVQSLAEPPLDSAPLL